MTWANQVRVLKQQFQALGAVIGQGLIQALKPALIAFNAFLTKVIAFAKEVLNALGKIFGWEIDISASGIDDSLDGAEGLADSLGDVGDAADGAGDSVKKLNKQLQGFDKLNVLTTNDSSSGSGGSGGSGSGGSGSGGSGSTADVSASIKKTAGLFESDIDSLYELGTAIKDRLMSAMERIPWDKIYEKAKNFGSGLASFLNGLFSGTGKHNVFASLGRTVAGAINTAINFFDSFATYFNFDKFGENLASFFVETVANIDWTKAGKAFHKWMQGIKKAFKSFVKYLVKHKDEVWKAITDFFSECTIEDIAIAIGTISLMKIGKWLIFGQGATTLAAGLAKWIGTVALKKIGVSIGAFELSEVAGAAGTTGGLTIGEMLASTIAAAAPVALPLAAIAVLSFVGYKVSEKEYSEWEDAMAAVNRLVTAGMSGEPLKATVAWQVLHEINVDKQGAFVGDMFGEMFTDYTVNDDGSVTTDMTWKVALGIDANENGVSWGTWGSNFVGWLENVLGWDEYENHLVRNSDGSYTYSPTLYINPLMQTASESISSAISGGLDTVLSGVEEVACNVKLNLYKGTFDSVAQKVIEAPATITKSVMQGLSRNGTWDSDTLKVATSKNGETTTRTTKQGLSRNGKWDSDTLTIAKKGKDTIKRALKMGLKRNNKWDSDTLGIAKKGGGNVYRTLHVSLAASASDALKKALSGAGLTINSAMAKIVAKLATGGIFRYGSWQPIQGYASGGMPSSAEVFMARENGPELVGTIGGHTAVMNNDQIVASVANGVAQANSAQNELLRQQNALLRQILAKETGITSRDIFDAVRSENRNYTNRTGKSAFSF